MKANYVSVWDGGTKIVTPCEYDLETQTVSNIEKVDGGDVDVLDDSYLEFPDGTILRKFNIEGEEPEKIKCKQVGTVLMCDPDTHNDVHVTIIKLETGGMMGVDTSFLENGDEDDPVYSVFDKGIEIDTSEL